MSLSPLLVLRVVKSKSDDSLSHLSHHVDPEKEINLLGLPAKKLINLWNGAKVESTRVRSALLVTG